jgi:hypothetical protein
LIPLGYDKKKCDKYDYHAYGADPDGISPSNTVDLSDFHDTAIDIPDDLERADSNHA